MKQIGSILLNKKNKYEVLMDPISDSKSIRKKQSNETRFFYENTYGRTIWFKCAISRYYFKIIGILSKNAQFTPIFCIIWTVLKILSNHYFHPLFHACHQVEFKKNVSNQNRKDISAWRTSNILLNAKTTEKKSRFVSKSSQHSSEWQSHKKEELLIEKIGSIILNEKNIK